jgi:hypothetical protein
MYKIAFILKGYYILDENTKGIRYSNKFVKYYNFIEQVLYFFYIDVYLSFKSCNYDVDYYFITYSSIYDKVLYDKIIELIPNIKLKFLELDNNSTSINLLYEGIKYVNNIKKYDRYIIVRNDMIYKLPIHKWLPIYNGLQFFYYLFDELTLNSGRISDCLHIIDNNIDKYIELLEECINNYKNVSENENVMNEQYNTLHGILPLVKKYFENYDKIIKYRGFDTNTAYPWGTSNNPIYKLAGRDYHFK